MDLEILFQDESLIAVNKPAGLLSIQDGYDKTKENVKSILMDQFNDVWTIHRLDKDTSGVLLFALNPIAHRDISLQFQNKQIEKTYFSINYGAPKELEFSVNLPLRINGDRKHRTVIDKINGKVALTKFSVIKIFSGYSSYQVNPQSGYTHQIRAHALAYGIPIIGDKLYFPQDMLPVDIPQLARLALHAGRIAFFNQKTHNITEIIAPIPIELKPYF